MNKRKVLAVSITVIFLSAVVVCLGGWMIVRNILVSPLCEALPPTAGEIQEWHWNEGGLTGQDYVYLLRAKITEQEFREYVDNLGWTPYMADREYGFVWGWYPHELHSDEEIEWWTPSEDSNGAYIHSEDARMRYAKWEDGYIYVVSVGF